jgi:2-aminoadipate transaminase
LPIDRRRRIVDIAKRWSQSARLVVIEDVAYRELLYSGDDIPSMRSLDAEGDTVVLAGTFSKPFSPGIRVGWGLLPEYLVEPVGNQKGNIDFGSPNFNQLLMAKVLELNLFDPHVQTLCAQYRKKMGAMLDAMDTHLSALPGVSWVKPTGGLYVWLRLPAEIDAGPGGKLLDEAMREGMFYVPGEYCYPLEGEPACKNTLRLSFGVQSTERIRIGIESLARAIRKFVG